MKRSTRDRLIRWGMVAAWALSTVLFVTSVDHEPRELPDLIEAQAAPR